MKRMLIGGALAAASLTPATLAAGQGLDQHQGIITLQQNASVSLADGKFPGEFPPDIQLFAAGPQSGTLRVLPGAQMTGVRASYPNATTFNPNMVPCGTQYGNTPITVTPASVGSVFCVKTNGGQAAHIAFVMVKGITGAAVNNSLVVTLAFISYID